MKESLKRKSPWLYTKLGQIHIFLIRLRARFFRVISDYYENFANGKTELGPIETKSGWSVVIITAGTSNDILKQTIKSIEGELNGSPFEIIIVGPQSLKKEKLPSSVRLVTYKELNISPGFITKKKNIGVAKAQYDKVVLSHDYVSFAPGWKNGFDKFGSNWDVCMTKVINTDGTRWNDWLGYFPSIGYALIPYDTEGVKYQYISGTYFIVKRNFFAKYPLNEKLRWGEGEDAFWSSQIRNFTKFKMNTESAVKLLRYKKLREELIPNGEKVKAMFLEK